MQKSKKGLDILLLLPQRGCIPNFRKFGSSDLEKMRYERTDGRTDGTEIIGPSGKIPGTNNVNVSLKSIYFVSNIFIGNPFENIFSYSINFKYYTNLSPYTKV